MLKKLLPHNIILTDQLKVVALLTAVDLHIEQFIQFQSCNTIHNILAETPLNKSWQSMLKENLMYSCYVKLTLHEV